MKKALKVFAGLLIALLLAIGLLCLFYFRSDKPYSEVKERYSLPNSRFAEVEGMPAHYTIEGEGHESLVLLHGTSSSLHTWEAWIPHFSNDYRIIRVDLPAFGLTGPHPKGQYDRATYLQFLHSFFNAVQLDSFHLAGNSFGGYLAWNYALQHPEKVGKLVLLDASGYPREDVAMPLGFRLAQNDWTAPILNKITPKPVVEKSVLDAYENDSLVTPEVVQRYYDLLLREGNRSALTGKMRQIKPDHPEDIARVSTPTLILWGDRDEFVPPAHAYRFHKDIKGSDLIIYQNVGHLPMEEAATRSARDVKAFLAE